MLVQRTDFQKQVVGSQRCIREAGNPARLSIHECRPQRKQQTLRDLKPQIARFTGGLLELPRPDAGAACHIAQLNIELNPFRRAPDVALQHIRHVDIEDPDMLKSLQGVGHCDTRVGSPQKEAAS